MYEEDIAQIKKELSQREIKKAEELVRNKKVYINRIELAYENRIISVFGEAGGTDVVIYLYTENLNFHSTNCRRDWHTCEHALALLMEVNQNQEILGRIVEIQRDIKERKQREQFKSMLSRFKSMESPDESSYAGRRTNYNKEIDIMPVINDTEHGYEITFKIGTKKMYKIKNIELFYENYKKIEIHSYGTNLAFKHCREAFCNDAIPYLNLLLKYGEMCKYSKQISNVLKKRYYEKEVNLPEGKIIISKDNLEEFIECIKNSNHKVEINKEIEMLEFQEKEPEIEFELNKLRNNKYSLNLKDIDITILEGYEKSYIIEKGKIFEYSTKKYEDVMNLIKIINDENVKQYIFDEKGLADFVNIVMPKIKDNVDIDNLPKEDKDKYIPKNLGIKLKLDLNEEQDIILEVVFCYGNIEFNPFEKNVKIPRQNDKERSFIDEILNDGFKLDSNRRNWILSDEEDTYNFLTDRINTYMSKYEVLVTDKFKVKQVHQPKIQSLGIKIQNNLLSLDLTGINYDSKELKEIMDRYRLKKKFYRLKDGSFLSLAKNDDMDFLENLSEGLDIDYKELAKGEMKLPINRSLYLNKLLENLPNTQVEQNSEYKKLIEETQSAVKDEDIEIPKCLKNTLRPYQKTGYKWLTILDKYRFGGILADDMGLRKNIASNSITFTS